MIYFSYILLLLLLIFIILYIRTKNKLNNEIKNVYSILDSLPYIIVIHDMEKIYYLSPLYKKIVNKKIESMKDYLDLFPKNERIKILNILAEEKNGYYQETYREINGRKFYIISRPMKYNGKNVSIRVFNDITDYIKKEHEIENMNSITEIINQLFNLTYSNDYNLKGTLEVIYNYLKKLKFIDMFAFAEIEGDKANLEVFYKNKKIELTSYDNEKRMIWYMKKKKLKKLYIENTMEFKNEGYGINMDLDVKEFTLYIFSFYYENEMKGVFSFSKIGKNAYSQRDKKIIELLASQIDFILKYQYTLFNYHKDKEYFKNLANKDPLTKLYSRNFFNEWIIKHSGYLKRKNKKSIFVMIDVNKFKRINDTYGHSTGDDVLRFIGNKIIENIRVMDIGVRFGGDEFLIVFPDTNIEDINKKMEVLCKEIRDNKFYFDIDISYGISEFNGENYIESLKKADEKMYEMKKRKNGG